MVVSCVYGWCGARGQYARVLGKGLELLCANGDRFEINELLFADHTALVSDSGEKLYSPVSEFYRVYKEEN